MNSGKKPERRGKANYLVHCGYLVRPADGEDYETATARWKFIQAVKENVPAFLTALRDRVYPAFKNRAEMKVDYWEAGWSFETWCTLSDSQGDVSRILVAWAHDFSLENETWVLEGALQTLSLWYEDAKQLETLSIEGFRRFPARRIETDGNDQFTFEDAGWDPQLWRLTDWRMHIMERFREELKQYEERMSGKMARLGIAQSADWYTPDHFTWLARYQCGHEPLEAMVGTRAADRTTISKGIKKAAQLARMRVRPKARLLKVTPG